LVQENKKSARHDERNRGSEVQWFSGAMVQMARVRTAENQGKQYRYAFSLRRMAPTVPIKPVPSRIRLLGSGVTNEGGGKQLRFLIA
jgi:hypothetical protein